MADKRELILDLLSRNKMGPGTAAAARDLDKVGDAADKTNKRTEALGRSSTVAGERLDKLGRNASETERHVASLDREIDSATRNLAELAVAFTAAGSAAERMDISKAINRTQRDLRSLTKNKNILESILPDPAPAARNFVSRLNTSINSAFKSAPPLALAGGVLGAAFAPTIASAVMGAVVGGVGAGGIIGGLALVAKDPEIEGQARAIGSRFTEAVNASARNHFLAPAKQGLVELDALATRTSGRIDRIFAATAPSTNSFIRSLVSAVDSVSTGFERMAANSAGPLRAIGRIIEDTGHSVEDLFTTMADHADDGASALDDLNLALQNTIRFVTMTVDALGTMKGGMDDLDGWIDKQRYKLEDMGFALDLTADGYKQGSEAAELYRQGIIGAAGSANDYAAYLANGRRNQDQMNAAMREGAASADDQRASMSALSKELRAQSDPAFALLNAQDNLTQSQKNLNAAIKKHGANSTEARAATRQLATAALDLQGRVGDLGGTFNGKLTPAMRRTLGAAGLTKSQINAVEREFRQAAAAGRAFSGTYRAKIITEYINKYSSIGKASMLDSYNATKKSIGKRASGGPVNRGVPYLVGEAGPEIVVPRENAAVLSAAASRGVTRAASMTMAPAKAAGGTMRLEVAGEQQVATFLRSLIRKYDIV